MPTYEFEAWDMATTTEKIKDFIIALSEEEAQQKIKQMGYFVTKITKVADGKTKGKGKAGQTPVIDKLSTMVMGPFRRLIRFFQKPEAKPPRKAGEAKPTAEEKAGGKKPMPKSAPVRQIQAAPGGRRIGQVLMDLGFVDEDQLRKVLDEAKITGNLTGQVAILRGLITEEQLIQALAELHNLRNGGGMTRTWHGVGTLIPPDFAREG